MNTPSSTDSSDMEVKVLLKEYQHLVADATRDALIRKEDGSAYFVIQGKELPARKVQVQYLRKFAIKNDIRKSQPPYYKLSRGSTQQQLVDEALNMVARRENDQPDPWLPSDKTASDKFLGYVNRYRLANVVFSEGLKDYVLGRGKCLSKEELDLGLETDQKLYQLIADEYNKTGVDEYDQLQCPIIIAAKNAPSVYSTIHWSMVRKIWKDCIQKLEQYVRKKNLSGNNDSSGDDGEPETKKSSTCHYVHYWYHFSEDNPNLYKAMVGELLPHVFNEIGTVSSLGSVQSCNKKQKKNHLDAAMRLYSDLQHLLVDIC
jgi:hypothetical protein